MFLVEGRKLVEEAIHSTWKIEAILINEEKIPAFSEADSSVIPTYSVPEEVFSQLNNLQQSEGILAVVHIPQNNTNEAFTIEGPAFLLEEIQDPGNLGTLIRTSAWFGFKHVYCSKGCVDAFNPKVLRASMGGIFHTQVHYLENWQEALEKVSDHILVGHLEGTKLGTFSIKKESLILIGNEARGVAPHWLSNPAIQKISIPGSTHAESLNAAIAGSILAWELYKCQ